MTYLQFFDQLLKNKEITPWAFIKKVKDRTKNKIHFKKRDIKALKKKVHELTQITKVIMKKVNNIKCV